jgi:hypothetical protein
VAAVTVDAAAKVAYFSSGNIGWSARSLYAYRTQIQQLVGASTQALGAATTNVEVGQSFTPGSAITLTEVRVVLGKSGSPVDNVILEIRADSSNKPSTTVLGTATNVYNGANVVTTASWWSFVFNTTVALSAGTKYWIVLKRSTAVAAASYLINYNTGSAYAGGGISISNAGTWSAESATDDFAFQVIGQTPIAYYAVTQDTSLHVFKSSDAVTWTEQDSANKPAVTNANFPFDASDSRCGPYLLTGYMTATNTGVVKLFDMSTDTWTSGTYGTTPPATVSNERTIRVIPANVYSASGPGRVALAYTDSVDDADIAFQRATSSTAAWTVQTVVLAATSTEASLLADGLMDKAHGGNLDCFYYDCANDDYSFRSLTSISGAQGTEVDISIAAASIETDHASATYQIYQNSSGVDTIIAAFIDAGQTVQERILNLEVTSASVTMATDNAVDSATTTAGRQLSTARYNGTNYIAVNVSGTGISYYTSTVAGTWSAATSFVSGLTNCTLSRILSIEGVGLAVIYTDNGDTKVDWIAVAGGGSSTVTKTATPVTIALSTPDKTRTATPVTMALQTTPTRTATPVTASLATVNTRTATPVTAALIATLTRSATATIALQAVKTRTATPVTVATQATSSRTATPVTLSLTSQATRTSTPVTAALTATLTRTAGTTTALSDVRTRTAPASMALSIFATRTASPVTAALGLTSTRTATPITAALLATRTRTATPATIAVQFTATRTASVTIALIATLSRTSTPVTMALSGAGNNRTASPVTAALSATLTRTASATMALGFIATGLAIVGTPYTEQLVTGTTQAFSPGLAAGGTRNLLVAQFALRTGAAISITGVVDSGGHTWTFREVGYVSGSTTRVEFWTAIRTGSAVATITATLSGTAVASLLLYEIAGQNSTKPIDTTQGTTAGDATADTTYNFGPITPTSGINALIIAGLSWGNVSSLTVFTPSTGWTSGGFQQGTSTLQGHGSVYQIANGTTGTYSGFVTTNRANNNGWALLSIAEDSGITTRRATPVTAALQSTSTRTATATAALQATSTRTASSTIATQSTGSRTATAITAALLATRTRSASATIAVQTQGTRTATPTTAALIATLTRTASSTIALSGSGGGRTASPVTMALSAILTRTSTATMALQTSGTRTATPVTAALSLANARTATATAAVLETRTRTAAATIALSGILTRTASATIALSGAGSVRTASPVTIALQTVGNRSAAATIATQATSTRTSTPVTLATRATTTEPHRRSRWRCKPSRHDRSGNHRRRSDRWPTRAIDRHAEPPTGDDGHHCPLRRATGHAKARKRGDGIH